MSSRESSHRRRSSSSSRQSSSASTTITAPARLGHPTIDCAAPSSAADRAVLQRRVSFCGATAPPVTLPSSRTSRGPLQPSGSPMSEDFRRSGGFTSSPYRGRGAVDAPSSPGKTVGDYDSFNRGAYDSLSRVSAAGSSRIPSFGGTGSGVGDIFSGRSDGGGGNSSFLMNSHAPPPSYGSLGPGQMNSCGSMDSNGFGTMWGTMMPMDSMRMIPMVLVPASSLYSVGGPYGSFASVYGLGPPMGSMYGMLPMGMMSSMYNSNRSFGGAYDGGAGTSWMKEGAGPTGSFFTSSIHASSASSPSAGKSSSNRTVDSEKGGVNVTDSTPASPMNSGKANATAISPTTVKIPASTQSKGTLATGALGETTVTTETKKESSDRNTVRALAVVTGARSPVAAVPGKLEVVVAAAGAAETAMKGSALRKLRDQWLRGHCSTLVIACGAGQHGTSLALVSAFVDACFARLKTTSIYSSVSVSLVAIKDAESGQDLLKSGATYEKMSLASSPIYGPALQKVTTEEVADTTAFRAFLKKGVRRIRNKKDLIVCLCVLKQLQKARDTGDDLLVSALNVTVVGDNLTYLSSFKAKSTTGVPRHLFRYAFYGGSYTVCATCVSADDPTAKDSIDAVRKMSDISNSAPHSGSVKRFVDYANKKVAKYRTDLSRATDPAKKKAYAKSMNHVQQILEDVQRLQKDPKKETAKVYSVKESAL